MPLYSFQNDQTGEVRDIFFSMNDKKEYFGEDTENPVQWRRLYTSPNMSIDTKVSPFSAKDFIKKTQNAKTYGEMFDLSAEMSQKRSDKLGAPDPQRQRRDDGLQVHDGSR